MKNIYFFILLVFVIITSCEKEDEKKVNVSEYIKEWQYCKDIEVTDESGENSVFLSIKSNEQNLLDAYLENIQFNLSLNSSGISSTMFSEQKTPNLDSLSPVFNLSKEPKIVIELIADNIKQKDTEFQLEFKTKNLKSNITDFLWDNPTAYETSGDFIGVFHWYEGYEFFAAINYRTNWYNLLWKSWEVNGKKYWLVDYGQSFYFGENKYKTMLIIYPHKKQVGINYRLAYSRSELRGSDCSIGSFDGHNCFVSSVPTGSNAFVYPDKYGALYYTPVSGNKCPNGGGFDGANCKVADIPAGTWGFVYNNSLYVVPNSILD